MENVHGNMHVLCFHVIIYTKAQKHAHFDVFSLFSASFHPHYIIIVKGLLNSISVAHFNRVTTFQNVVSPNSNKAVLICDSCCIYTAHLSPALNESSEIYCISNAATRSQNARWNNVCFLPGNATHAQRHTE